MIKNYDVYHYLGPYPYYLTVSLNGGGALPRLPQLYTVRHRNSGFLFLDSAKFNTSLDITNHYSFPHTVTVSQRPTRHGHYIPPPSTVGDL